MKKFEQVENESKNFIGEYREKLEEVILGFYEKIEVFVDDCMKVRKEKELFQ